MLIGKKACLLLFAALMCIFLVIPKTALAAENRGLRYTISVNKFENRADWSGSWDITDAWGVVLTNILNQTGRFSILDEQDLACAGSSGQDFIAPETGTQSTPAQLQLNGMITQIQDDASFNAVNRSIGRSNPGSGKSLAEINVTLYIVDPATGQVLGSTNVVGRSNSFSALIGYSKPVWPGTHGSTQHNNLGKAIENAAAQGTEWLIAQLSSIPWQGEVVKLNGGKVYVNRGAREGVRSGQTFIVCQNNIIRDLKTDEILGSNIDKIARLRVVAVKEKFSACQVVSGDAKAITKGMMIQLP